MRHNTHSWSWAICLSFTTVLSWVIPFECLRGSTAVAAPVPIPIAADDRGDRPPPIFTEWIPRELKRFAESTWHPVMDLLGSERTYHFSTMGELVLDDEIDRDNPLHHGMWIEGTWGDTVPVALEVLAETDCTIQAHMQFNGMGTTPNEDYLIYIEEDIRVVETAVVVHNLLTGARLGMNLELAWFEANDDDSDGITSIPLALPTRVIEDPGHEFFAESKLYDDYSDWCDFVLTQEGQWRAEDQWTAECEEGGLDLCIRGFCNGQNAQDGDWSYCQTKRMYDSCGNLRDEGLGLEYQQYLLDLEQCDVNLRDCLLMAGGIGVGGASLLLKILEENAKKVLRCRLLGLPASICVGGTVISVAWKVWGCWDNYNLCKANAELNWKRAQDQDRQNEIDRQCQ